MVVSDHRSEGANLSGRRVVLTGASRGLGEALAHAFSRAGAQVALVARSAPDLERVSAALPGDALALAGDVTDADFNHRVAGEVVAAWGGLDVWIANAGVAPTVGGPLETTPEQWRQVLDVNLTGAFLGARAAAAHLGPGGRLIFTGSVLGERPRAGLAAYSASKAGMVATAKALALDLAAAGVTVNVVAPGWFDTPLTEGWMRNPALSERITGHTALRRWGDPAELTGAYLFLASEASSFVTGSVLTVDGGYLLV
ncbi:SDR family NAD(P)-dependent oxidoreductase [Candidatus Poriferisocius sp.]|uniref:SDR family NAD(P)-dependent oxidoreductase n=1 Tax=Candidatus Poriferisocius sp. TaxID=3101276 RepID=UPI003B5C045F